MTATTRDRTRHTTRHTTRQTTRTTGRYVLLVLMGLLFVSPLLFMLVTSFKTSTEASAVPPTWVPHPFTTQAYTSILGADGTPVLRWFVNSMIAGIANSALVVATAALAAYPLARMEFRGKRFVFGAIVATLFVPPVILIIPNYLIVGQLKWLDTLVAVIVPTAAGAFSPGCVFPQANHGGPGRAGGGSELGGRLGMELYMQRIAVQGGASQLARLLGGKPAA